MNIRNIDSMLKDTLNAKMSLSIVAEHDEIVRISNILLDGACEPEFLRFGVSVDDWRMKLLSAQKECERLMQELQSSNLARTELERHLRTARNMVDMEKKKRRSAEEKFLKLESQMTLVRDLVWDGRNKLHDETRERLASVYSRANSYPSLGSKGNVLPEHPGQKFHNSECGLSTISEDSTGSLLSELGYTRSGDELDVSQRHSKGWRKHRPSIPSDAPCSKKPRSSFTTHNYGQPIEANHMAVDSQDCLVATTTVTMSREGPMTAKSTIETIPSQEKINYNSKSSVRQPLAPTQPKATPVPSAPPPPSSLSESEESLIVIKEKPATKSPYLSPAPCTKGINLMAHEKLNSRPHVFCYKTMVKTGSTCEPCGKRLKFAKQVAKCRECHATVHTECRERLPLPCVPSTCTPIQKGQMLGFIADFAPSVPPMVPGLVVHCINEIEARGLKEVGLYRIPGAERDVKALKEKFMSGRGAPNLSNYDIHVICGVVKDFLRSLREPLVTPSSWSHFVRCVEPPEEVDQQARLYQVVSDLPRPNSDTLSFIILHLQRVSECPECKMPALNLAKVFGPTIVGYSSTNPEPTVMMRETLQTVSVMMLMLKTPSSYWACRINPQSYDHMTPQTVGLPSRNPSSASRSQTGGFFGTPKGTIRSAMRGKFFSQL